MQDLLFKQYDLLSKKEEELGILKNEIQSQTEKIQKIIDEKQSLAYHFDSLNAQLFCILLGKRNSRKPSK